MGFVNRMDQNVAKYWYLNEKWWWFPFVWMVDVAVQDEWVLYRINKDKADESLASAFDI